MGVFSKLADKVKDVVGFEKSHLDNMVDKVKADPERLVVGAADPFSSKVWGKVLNKDYTPIVDQFGGAPADSYQKAANEGVDIRAGAAAHTVARTIASAYALQYASGGAGPTGESGTATTTFRSATAMKALTGAASTYSALTPSSEAPGYGWGDWLPAPVTDVSPAPIAATEVQPAAFQLPAAAGGSGDSSSAAPVVALLLAVVGLIALRG